MHGILDTTIDATQDVLRERLKKAQAAHAGAHGAREDYPQIDTFMASTSRHLAGFSAALLPYARRSKREEAQEFVAESRRLELALCQAKAKLYGEAHAIHLTWQQVWTDVVHEFETTMMLETRLVRHLVDTMEPATMDDLALRLYHAELHAPTRPHPHLPHDGMRGRVARRMATTVDRFWDNAQGRVIPEPRHPHDHSHDGLMTHYLLADVDPDE